ncbi:hypothetical protein [Lactiplantibacillus plantarum]|uniref:hypothetical protein n=1 Tax=Lactiplantibacillus plantarum TaxID=1590 RepID=UPI0007B549EB|nr:hypothetical protein [Lactiplantibacillus plantarum]QBA80126.1 hypothetical protein EVF25_06490 [Lactiplantibacillus plantarum]RDG23988.1 hypothetical protein DQM20_14180 [Lactiplantibacillus plantarum]
MQTTLKIVLCGTLEDVRKRMALDYERMSKIYLQANVVRHGHTIEINSTWINKYISVRQLKNIDGLKPRYVEADVSAFLVATSKQMELVTKWYQSVSVINYGKDD